MWKNTLSSDLKVEFCFLPDHLKQELSYYILNESLLFFDLFVKIETMYPGSLVYISSFMNIQSYLSKNVIYAEEDFVSNVYTR